MSEPLSDTLAALVFGWLCLRHGRGLTAELALGKWLRAKLHVPPPPKVWYCPACLHVVSKNEGDCRHCGHRYGSGLLDRALGPVLVAAFVAFWLAAVGFAYWLWE